MVPLLALALSAPPADRLPARQVYEKTLAGTAWVLTPADRTGTAWVADRDRRLLVTNAHVVADTDQVKLHFPARKDGQLLRQAADYLTGLKPVNGVVIDRDANRDLALIRADRLPPEAAALVPAAAPAAEGDEVRTVGGSAQGSDGFLWGNVRGEVRSVGVQPGRRGRPLRVVLTDVAINRGNSGGPLVNDRAEVVGVNATFQADARSVSTHIDAAELVTFLREAGPLVEPKGSSQFAARGRRRAAEGRFAAAVADFTAALKGHEADPDLLVARGAAHKKLGDGKAALADLDAAVESAPTHLPARVGRAEALLAAGRPTDALADADAAVRAAPGKPDGYAVRGGVRAALGKPKADRELLNQAVGDFTRAIGLDPKSGRLLADRAAALRLVGNRAEAIDDLRAAIKLEGWNPDHHDGLGLLLTDQARAEADEAKKRDALKAAAKCFLAAAEASRDAPEPLVHLGDALRRLNEPEAAAKVYTGVIAEPAGRTPRLLFRAFHGRGVCQRLLKEYAAAVRDFDKALGVDKFEPTAVELAGLLRQKAEAHRGLGETKEVAACLARADQLVPPKPPAAPPAKTPPKGTPAKAAPPLVGTWRHTGVRGGRQGDITAVFHRDGTFTLSLVTTEPGKPRAESKVTGKYTFDGKELVFSDPDGGVRLRWKARLAGDTLTVDPSGTGKELSLARQK